jgi:undecaprenyl phosphate-alpha-L-ara4FN deformylase
LRIDVDTHDGMKTGVPSLLDLLERAGVKGTFYLSMGPDNAGKAIFNILQHPGLLNKMRRAKAARVYGLRQSLGTSSRPA